jgi:hypothetical protein
MRRVLSREPPVIMYNLFSLLNVEEALAVQEAARRYAGFLILQVMVGENPDRAMT